MKHNKNKVTDAVIASPTSETYSEVTVASFLLKINAISSIKRSKNRNLLILDNQGKVLDIGNFNVLSPPGAKLEHIYNFIPEKDLYDIIGLFIGSESLFATVSETLVRQISDLANLFLNKAENFFVRGIPLSHFQPYQAKEVKPLLASCQESWLKV